MSEKTYYQRNRKVTLNKAKDHYRAIKKNQKNKQEVNMETYLKKKKTKRENMETMDIIICLRKRNKD